MRKLFAFVWCAVLFVMPSTVIGQQGCKSLKDNVIEKWSVYKIPEKNSVPDIFKYYEDVNRYTCSQDSKDTYAILENKLQAVSVLGYYYSSHQDVTVDGENKENITNLLKSIDIFSPEFLSQRWSVVTTRLYTYYLLRYVTEGDPVSQAFGKENKNEYQYKVYKEVLNSGNEELMLLYCPSLITEFRYEGYSPLMKKVRPLLEQKLPEGDLKKELRVWYENFDRLEEGQPAPAFTLKDDKGKMHSLADFRGKMVVMDVWATWCGGCVAKLPKFLEIAKKYKDRKDVVFMIVSIDDAEVAWKKKIKDFDLNNDIINLLAPPQSTSFKGNYILNYIPKYIIIDEKGKFITSAAPTVGGGFEEYLENVLKKKK